MRNNATFKIMNSMAPCSRILMLGWGSNGNIVKCISFMTFSPLLLGINSIKKVHSYNMEEGLIKYYDFHCNIIRGSGDKELL